MRGKTKIASRIIGRHLNLETLWIGVAAWVHRKLGNAPDMCPESRHAPLLPMVGASYSIASSSRSAHASCAASRDCRLLLPLRMQPSRSMPSSSGLPRPPYFALGGGLDLTYMCTLCAHYAQTASQGSGEGRVLTCRRQQLKR